MVTCGFAAETASQEEVVSPEKQQQQQPQQPQPQQTPQPQPSHAELWAAYDPQVGHGECLSMLEKVLQGWQRCQQAG